jgi:hypothetical protein
VTDENAEQAEMAAKQRLREKAESYHEDLEEAFFNVLPGNQSPAETVFIAHLMTAIDGYNDVKIVSDWTKRPRSGWQTVMVYLPELEGGLTATFGFECRYEEHFRQLAILIDGHRPGERLPEKMERERRLTSLDFRVMSFSEMEILADPTECRERVEGVLSDMVDELLVDSGQIRGKQD